MKKRFIVFWLFMIVLACQLAQAGTQASYYVDPVNGNDANSGTSPVSAFRTIGKARDVIRTVNSSMTGDIFVYLRGGTHSLSQTLTFSTQDSGTNGYYIIYKAYPNEVPVLSGERKITGWTLHDSNRTIYKARVGSAIDTRQVYVNGIRATRARSTDTLTAATYDSIGHTTTDTFLATWKNISDLEMVYRQLWTNPRCGVSTISASGGVAHIVMKQPGWRYCRNKGLTSAKTPWYYENAYELLDSAGEWYLDKSGAIDGTPYTLYYKPFADQPMATADVVIPTLDKLLTMQGTSLDAVIHNLRFEGLQYQYTTWLRPSTNDGHADAQNNVIRQAGQEFIIDGAAVTLKYAQSVLFIRCGFQRLGGTGINFYAGCQNNAVQGCRFVDISANGVQVGDYLRYKDTLTENHLNTADLRLIMRNNDIKNNYFNHNAVEYRSACAIGATFPQLMSIEHNEIANMPYMGIHVGWGWQLPKSIARNNLIKHNYIHDVMMELDDGAGIYTLGPHGSSVNKSAIDSNYVRTSRDHALYFDEGSSWYTATTNVFDDIVSVNINISTPDKHDLSVTNTFADDGTFWNKGTNVVVTPITVATNGNWPPTARYVMNNAGLEPDFLDIRATTYVQDPFNATAIGAGPAGWSTVATGGTVGIVDVPGNGDRSLKLTKTNTANTVSALRSVDPVSGTVTCSVSIRSDATAGWRNAPYLLDKNGQIAVSVVMRDGSLQVYDGPGQYTTLQPFSANTWYTLKLVLNTESRRFDAYVNGVLKLSQHAFRNPVSDISQVWFAMDVNNTGTLYVDNVNVYADLQFLNTTFNATPTGAVTYGWTTTTTGGTVAVANLPSSSNKSLTISKTGTATVAEAVSVFEPTSGTVVVRASVRAETTAGWKSAPYVMDRNGNLATCLIFKDGLIQLYKGSGSYVTVKPFTAGTWYALKLVLNTETDLVDVYVDDTLHVSGTSFRSKVPDIGRVLFSIGDGQTGTVYVDDVQVYNASPTVSSTAGARIAAPEIIVDQNYPNTFESATTFRFFLPQKGKVTIALYTEKNGQLVSRIVDEQVFESGWQSHYWQRPTSGFQPGLYFFQVLVNGGKAVTRRLIIR